ncbi:MAG: hypothetical protein JJU36_07380 [Phycisphaeraceae bacterium]|nr:hypothetical protein [Phycisphaeraceae bacterium]
MFTFSMIEELRKAHPASGVAIQIGPAAGLWTRCADNGRQDNGGHCVRAHDGTFWQRACDPGRVEARWFGVKADGRTDDAEALQRAIDSLPEAGGVVLLPAGRMRCGSSLRVSQPYITIEGTNCGLRSKYFEPGHAVGQGSLLKFDQGVDGIIIERIEQRNGSPLPRLGGISLRNFGISGSGRQAGQTGIICRPAKGGRWGSTDALLLERLYVIECAWSAHLKDSDAGIIDKCWFSECANGLNLDQCIYTVVTASCFADNDHVGVQVLGGKSNEIVGGIFVRNERGIVLKDTKRMRINGGTFETDAHGGDRLDRTLIQMEGESEATVTGATFFVEDQAIRTAIQTKGHAKLDHSACQIGGELTKLTE